MILVKTSDLTGVKHRMEIPMSRQEFMEAYNAWNGGLLIQDAFPDLAAHLREFIMTGVTPDEWDELFGGDE